MSFSIRLTKEERLLAKSYAKLHSITMGEAFKSAFFDKVEDEFDLKAYDHAYEEYEKSGKQSRPIDELWTELDL